MMSVGDVLDIAQLYESIGIQTRQVTVNNLNTNKIEYNGNLLILKINSNEDVIIDVKDIKAIYGKNRRNKI